jgi:hypothetical protein
MSTKEHSDWEKEYRAKEAAARAEFAERYGDDNVWTTDELTSEFEVTSFLAPIVFVQHLETGIKGTLSFQHSPRVYFDFRPDDPERWDAASDAAKIRIFTSDGKEL